MNTAKQWIEKGYEHFAYVGPINFSIKKISEENNLSRTTFNYHFVSQEEYIKELLAAHIEVHREFLEAAKKEVKQYIPDLHILISKFPIGIRFHLQLFNHRYNDEFDRVYKSCNKLADDEFIIQRFIEYYKLQLTTKEAANIHEIITDAWYSSLNTDDISVDALILKAEGIMKSMMPLFT